MMNCVSSHVFRCIYESLKDLAPTFTAHFIATLREYRKDWDETSQMEVCQSKKFWKENADQLLLQTLRKIPEEANKYITIQLKEDENSQYVKLVDVVAMALASARFSYSWTKCKTVTENLFTDHQHHASNLIAFLSRFKCQMNPSVHYWLDHAVEDVKSHGAPHYLIQEQGESKNAMHGIRKTTTCRGRKAVSDHYNTWECLMRHEFALEMLCLVTLPDDALSSARQRLRQVFFFLFLCFFANMC
jgi:hypothetical protein